MMRSQLRLIAVCCGALLVPLVIPLSTGQVFTRDDLAAMHLPFRYVYQQALRSGDSFLWASALRSGLYLHGEGEGGFAHPLHLLLYRFLSLGPAFNVEIISSYVAMLAGTGLLLLRFGLTSEAAWFGAMVFAFSGFNLFNLMHVNHIATMAHAPWIMLGAYGLLTSRESKDRAWFFAGTSLVVGSQLLIGNPQYVWMTCLALGFMTLCVLRAGASYSRLPLLAGAVALGWLIGGIQLLPTLDFVTETKRVAWSADQSLSFSLSPLNLVQLWSPFAFQFRVYAPPSEALIVHEFIVYNGAFCTVALTWLAMRWRQQTRKGLLKALLAFAAVSFVLAMGRHGLVYAWLAHLPGLSTFRAPARHLVLFQLALSGIAAVVFEDLVGLVRTGRKTEMRRLWPLAVPVALSVTITAVAGMLAQSSWATAHDISFSAVMRAAPWAGLVIVMTLLVGAAARGIRWAVPVIVVFAAFDLGLWGYSYAYRWGPLQTIDELAARAEVPAGAQRGDLISPMPGGAFINLPLFRGLRLATGYFGIETSSVLDPADPVTERLAGVAWRPIAARWESVPDTMPRARLVSVARRSGHIQADVQASDISQVALLDQSADPSILALSGDPGSVHVVADRSGSIVVDTTAPGRQLLVVTERFHSGWRARVDGLARATTRVYGDYIGCVVDPGSHRVALTFEPASARAGMGVSLAGLVLTLVAMTFLRIAKDRDRPIQVRTE